MATEVKTCKSCGVEQDIAEFPSYMNRGKIRFLARCKPCNKQFQSEQSTRYYAENKEICKAKAKAYSEAHRHEIKKNKAAYYQKNKEKHDAATKAHALANPDKAKLYRRRNYERTKDQKADYCRMYNNLNREQKRQWTRNHRARKRGLEGITTPEDIKLILAKQGGKCVYCERTFGPGLGYEADHIIPVTREGSTNWPSNIQLLCKSCNVSKSDKTHEEYLDYLKAVHPERYEKFKKAA